MNSNTIKPAARRSIRCLPVFCILLLAGCGGGGGGSDDGSGPANIAPTANAGPDQSVAQGSVVQLSGAASADADGSIVAYAWAQTAGPAATLSNAAIANPTFTAPAVTAAQILSFRLTVTDNAAATRTDIVEISVTPAAAALAIRAMELAQTHVLPLAGKSWTLRDGSGTVTRRENLHFTGGRAALALIGLSASDAATPRLEGVVDGVSLGTVTLQVPAGLPPTEDDGPAYATDRHSATVPASWMRPGLRFRVLASNYAASALSEPAEIGGDFVYRVRVLPFYLFGANDTNTGGRTLATIGAPDEATRASIFSAWPMAALDAVNHAAGRVQWSQLVIPPRGSGSTAQPAYLARSTNDYRGTFDALSAVLSTIRDLQDANGDAPLGTHYYAPLLALGSDGAYDAPGGGLGGGSVGAGDETYRGIFIHEQGHAFGLPHVGEAYDADAYPYRWGSLDGSAWGFHQSANRLLPTFLPPTASSFVGCAADTFGAANEPRARDSAGRCIKQDPMQSGSGDQSASLRYAMFSDYSNAVVQRYFEGTTTVGTNGEHTYSGGRLVRDSSFPGGYKRWDSLDRAWINVDDSTTGLAQGGFNKGLPIQRDVPVYAIILTISKAGTPGATQIYPPLRFTGNLLRTVDATNTADLASITPGGSAPFRWYCVNSGCDYTLRITYAGGTQRHIVLKGGFRDFDDPSGPFSPEVANPLDSDSFQAFAVNVPADLTITRVQLLNTPEAWTGVPTLLTPVLASYP